MKLYTIVYFMDYGKSFGGAYTTLMHQIVLMKKLGHNIIVFYSDYYGKGMSQEYQEICFQFDIQYEWGTYQISSGPEDIDVVCIDENYETLRDKVAGYHPDILHSVQMNPCAELISRELKVPHIMAIYQLLPDFFSVSYLDIFPHYHICDSLYYAEKWRQYIHTDSICIRTVAEKNVIRERKFSKKHHYICVGGIGERKNQLTVIKAFHKAVMQGIEGSLVLCGYADGEYYDKCKLYIEENGLENDIIIKGFCTDMRAEYADSDILICGSTCESYPNAISEAMANGLVIISTPVAGVPELIVDRKNGYLTDDYSVDALCEKIVQSSKDIENGCIDDILENAQNTYQENHSPQVVSRELLEYYQHVLGTYTEWANRNDLVMIDQLKSIFYEMLEIYKANKSKFTYPQSVSKKLWYLNHIFDIIDDSNNQEKKFYIWGTGKYGVVAKEMLSVFFPQICIRGFLDSKKIGKFYDYAIYSPDEIVPKDNTVILIAAVNGQSEMIKIIESVGKCFNKDYFILSERAL